MRAAQGRAGERVRVGGAACLGEDGGGAPRGPDRRSPGPRAGLAGPPRGAPGRSGAFPVTGGRGCGGASLDLDSVSVSCSVCHPARDLKFGVSSVVVTCCKDAGGKGGCGFGGASSVHNSGKGALRKKCKMVK